MAYIRRTPRPDRPPSLSELALAEMKRDELMETPMGGWAGEVAAPAAPQQTTVGGRPEIPPPPWHGQPAPPLPPPAEPENLGAAALAEMKARDGYEPPAPRIWPGPSAPVIPPRFPKPNWREPEP